jgi:hypothetical protein
LIGVGGGFGLSVNLVVLVTCGIELLVLCRVGKWIATRIAHGGGTGPAGQNLEAGFDALCREKIILSGRCRKPTGLRRLALGKRRQFCLLHLEPCGRGGLWSWCLNAGNGELLDVLAVAVAFGIDAVERKSDPNRSGKEHGNALTAALNLNMADWYRPTAAGYFGC